MENTIRGKLENLYTYNNYKNVECGMIFTTIAGNLTNIFTQIPTNVKNSIAYVTMFTTLAFLGMISSGGFSKTNEIKDINKLYQEFLKNYKHLNEVFDFDNPVEVYAMFNYLLYKGYLSNNKHFEFSEKQARDTRAIMGSNVMTGKGVCRHIAAMLTDILEYSGTEASTMSVVSNSEKVTAKFTKEQKYTKEELLEWINTNIHDRDAINTLTSYLNVLEKQNRLNIEFIHKQIAEKSIISRILGNHVITYAYKDGNSYFLDPTQGRIYVPNKKLLTDSQMSVTPRGNAVFSTLLNKRNRVNTMKKRLRENHPSLDLQEQEEIAKRTLNICKNNTDIFDQFYRENSEIYAETTNKVLSLNKIVTGINR